MAEIVLFIDANFGGLHTHIYQSTADFTQLARGGLAAELTETGMILFRPL